MEHSRDCLRTQYLHGWQTSSSPMTFVGFGVLGAMFPFHTWSPDGHASAPTAVSMLHAGVLMKLGGYGCFRVAIYLMPQAAHELAWIFLILTGVSVVYGAFCACVKTDLKYINAYSSVSHCGLVLFAILMLNTTAMTGAIMQMLSHGLMTALFFALIGMIYGRTHTREITQMGGMMQIMPYLSVCYVIAGMASLGLPGLRGFVAEMTIFVGSFKAGMADFLSGRFAPPRVHNRGLLLDCNHSGLHPPCCRQTPLRPVVHDNTTANLPMPHGGNASPPLPHRVRGSYRLLPQLLCKLD